MRRPAIMAIALSLGLATPVSADPPTIELTIDPIGTVTEDGGVTVRGTADCPAGEEVTADVFVGQKVRGHLVIEGRGVIAVVCGEPWVAEGLPSNRVDDQGNSLFKASPATASIFAFGCFGLDCVEVLVEAPVKLRRAKP